MLSIFFSFPIDYVTNYKYDVYVCNHINPNSVLIEKLHDEAEGGRFSWAAGQVGTPAARQHSVNPQQICFAEIRKYKNINSSWLVGVQSFSEIGDKKFSVQFSSLNLRRSGFAAGQVGTP